MIINPRYVYGILLKEIQDIKKNSNVLVMYVLPVFLTLLWNNFIPDMPDGFALGFGLLFLVVMVGMYVPSMLIAEEKEKKTLEVLLLSPASAGDVLLGKGLLTFISIILTTIILLFITATAPQHFLLILTGTTLISLFSISIGMMVGLLAPNQMATGTIGLPIYLLLLLVPQLAPMTEGGIMNLIARYLPTHYYFEMLAVVATDAPGLADVLYEIGIIVLSIIVSFTLLVFIYQKKGLRES